MSEIEATPVDDESPPDEPGGESESEFVGPRADGDSDRKRLLKLIGLFVLGFALLMTLKLVQGKAVEVTLVHRTEGASDLLPADIEIQVWDDDVLHADAYFPTPSSLDELEHSAVLPPGSYRIVYAIIRDYGTPEVYWERDLEIGDAGRYYLNYDLNR